MQTRGRPGNHPLKTFAAKLSNRVMRGGVRKARVRRSEERSRGVLQTHAGRCHRPRGTKSSRSPSCPGKWARALIVEPSCVHRFGLREPCPGTTPPSRNGESPRCLPSPTPWAARPSLHPAPRSLVPFVARAEPRIHPGKSASLRSGSS